MGFMNKVVIITGAGSGFGEAVALHLAKQSARLYLIDLNEENLKITTEKCEKLSRAKVFFAAADLRNDDLVKKVITDAAKQYGRIDIVINCAGIYKATKITDDDVIDTYDLVMTTNLRTIVRVINCVAPYLIDSKGCIVNISSVAAVLTTTNSFAYNITKTALAHFTKCIALELADKCVRVNSVLPGPSKMNFIINAGISREDSDALFSKASDMALLKRNAKPEEVAELAAYLASDKAKSMTGGNYLVDAGFSLLSCQDPPNQ